MTFWDFCAPLYDFAESTNKKAYSGMLKQIRKLVPNGANVLEIAAGTGSISLAVADKTERVVCTDLSERMLSVAKRKAKRRNLTNITFKICDIFNTGFADDEFDVVIAAQVLHLLDRPEDAVAELKRISRCMVIAPVCLLENVSRTSRMKVGLFRLFGFAPKATFDADGYRAFLTQIGIAPETYTIAEGAMPLAIPLWKKEQL